jgi:hypothetical protein
MTSKLSDLDDHLFSALNRLRDNALNPDQISAEVSRAQAVVAIADQITQNAKTKLVAAKLYAEHGAMILPHLPQIGSTK